METRNKEPTPQQVEVSDTLKAPSEVLAHLVKPGADDFRFKGTFDEIEVEIDVTESYNGPVSPTYTIVTRFINDEGRRVEQMVRWAQAPGDFEEWVDWLYAGGVTTVIMPGDSAPFMAVDRSVYEPEDAVLFEKTSIDLGVAKEVKAVVAQVLGKIDADKRFEAERIRIGRETETQSRALHTLARAVLEEVAASERIDNLVRFMSENDTQTATLEALSNEQILDLIRRETHHSGIDIRPVSDDTIAGMRDILSLARRISSEK